MLTKRKVFSTSLAISAISGEETTTSFSTTEAKSNEVISEQHGVSPPISLGVFRTL
jgi:hypothetical protein